MNREFIYAVFMRFLKAFVAGGLAQLTIQLSVSPAGFTSLAEFRTWAIALGVAFLTGGVMAVNKLVRFDPQKGGATS